MAPREAAAAVGIGLRQAHAAEFLARRPPLGFVEVHAENCFADGGAALAVLHEVRGHCAVSLHGVGLALGSAAGLDAWHLDRLARLVQRIDPVRVSDHAAFARAPRRAGGPLAHASDLLPVACTPAALQVMVDHVQRVQDRLRRPLLVENLAAYLRWADDALPEPEFFNQLARRSGCGLLLDVNNLVVNALNDGHDGPAAVAAACAWIDALEPSIVGEIHLAGWHDGDDLVIDDHGSRVRDEVWQVYSHALRRVGAVPTLVEWDTHLPALDVLLGEAWRAAGLLQAAVPVPTREALRTGAEPDVHRTAPGATPGVDREARRQQALLRALWRDDAPAALAPWLRGDAARQQRGLRAYQANAAATAERALSAAYPVVALLLGTDSFAALARGLWQCHAPQRGDLAQWGDTLADVIADRPELAGEPYLADVARLEWALHQALQAADQPPEPPGPCGPPGLERLGTHDPAVLRLRLRPGTAVVRSGHPIVAIWQAHQDEGGADADPPGADRFAAARAALVARQAESALVWRDGWRPTACPVPAAAAVFTQGLLQGLTLGQALQQAPDDFAFEPWLRQALGQGWLVGVDADADADAVAG